MRGKRTGAACLAVLLAVAAGLPTPARADTQFDISYLWHADLARVRDYRERLTSVLGTGIRERLLIVRGERAYGLIYDRNGDAVSTRDVADGHARLLRSRGLEGAAPILSRGWSLVADASADGISRAKSRAARSAPATRAPEVSGASQGASRLPPALSANTTTALEAAIQRFVAQQRRRGRVAGDERTSWAVYDLTSDRKLVSINADLQLQAASLIKPAVALAFFHRVAKGELHYGPRSRRNMEAMIRRSDNGATNWVMRHVGGPRGTAALLKRHYGDIFRALHLVEYIPGGGRTYRNRDSAHDYLRLLYAIWHDQVPYARELRRLMALHNRDRLTTKLPSYVRVWDKTGSTRSVCGNIGILEITSGGRRLVYALAGVIEKNGKARNYSSWISARGNVIREVSSLVYRELSSPNRTASR